MKVFVWERVNNATHNYHDEGGITVFAANLALARGLISQECPAECEALTTEPDLTADVSNDVAERIFVFPDAGCC